MRKIWKGILSFSLAVAVCFGVTSFYNAANFSVAEAYTTSASTYYNGITAKSGTALLGQLHDLIVDTHKTYTSYDDCRDYGPTTDPGPNGRGVMEFYTHETIMSFSGTLGTWNREHVWCQSLSNGLWGKDGGGSDLHHIRPSEGGLNSIRGNDKYGEVSGGKEAWSRDTGGNNSMLGGHSSGSTFEPLDNVKGDAARIIMYVYTHYNNASNVGGTKESAKTHGNLSFINVISASNEAAAKKLLLKWNKLDPVDEIERHRNEEVAKIQGNRNPFIDNESYAEAIWSDGTPIDPDPPKPDNTLKSLTLNVTALTMAVNDTYNLTVTPNPSTASASVTWATSNSAIATVANGKVTAKAAGTATITATSTSNSSITATATVTVKDTSGTSDDPVTGKITITRDSFTDASGAYGLYSWKAGKLEGTAYIYGGEGSKMQFNTSKGSHFLASTEPTAGPIRKITIQTSGNSSWSLLTSSMPYDDISSNGNPTRGNTHTASGGSWTVDGNDTYFALVLGGGGAGYIHSIEVEYASDGSSGDENELLSLDINLSAFALKAGESTKLSVFGTPSSANAEVEWSSSNTSVATVAADGTVTAVGAGSALITATSKENAAIKATATVTVTEAETIEPPSTARVDAFRDAVAEIDEGDSIADLFTEIKAAIAAYGRLTEADKAACAEDIAALNAAIASYNDKVSLYNDEASDAAEAALKGAGSLLQ